MKILNYFLTGFFLLVLISCGQNNKEIDYSKNFSSYVKAGAKTEASADYSGEGCCLNKGVFSYQSNIVSSNPDVKSYLRFYLIGEIEEFTQEELAWRLIDTLQYELQHAIFKKGQSRYELPMAMYEAGNFNLRAFDMYAVNHEGLEFVTYDEDASQFDFTRNQYTDYLLTLFEPLRKNCGLMRVVADGERHRFLSFDEIKSDGNLTRNLHQVQTLLGTEYEGYDLDTFGYTRLKVDEFWLDETAYKYSFEVKAGKYTGYCNQCITISDKKVIDLIVSAPDMASFYGYLQKEKHKALKSEEVDLYFTLGGERYAVKYRHGVPIQLGEVYAETATKNKIGLVANKNAACSISGINTPHVLYSFADKAYFSNENGNRYKIDERIEPRLQKIPKKFLSSLRAIQ